MQYKINEVSKITGVSVDNLRYYEKLGVFTPKINEKNRYRYYDDIDINLIFDFNNYRRLEYSSKEALYFIHSAGLKEQIEILEQKRGYYQDHINRYSRLLRRDEEILNQVHNIDRLLNVVRLGETPSCSYLPYRENKQFYGFKQYMGEIHQWLEKIEMTENAVIVPMEVMENRGENRHFWSFLVRTEDVDEVRVPLSENVRRIEAGHCVRILIETCGEGTFHYSLLDPAMEYIRKHHFRLCGNPYGILLIRSHDERGFHRYFDFYLPISDE